MANRILTTHVGSLPRTPELLEANLARTAGTIGEEQFREILERSVEDVVRRQREIGIDIINEGEYGHVTSGSVDYGAWWNYSFTRLGGLTMTDKDRWEIDEEVRSKPGEIRLSSMRDRRDRALFAEAYNDPDSGIFTGRKKVPNPEFTGPVTYIGKQQVEADVSAFERALGAVAGSDEDVQPQGFIAALSPGSAARLPNRYYRQDIDVVRACGEALHTEYKAITDAGLTVQFDAPDLAEAWDSVVPEPAVGDFQRFIRERIEVLNDSIADLPREQTRLHICWGSWHGPHVTDIAFGDIIEEILQAKVGGFSFEGASPRHAHEWRVWRDHKLPAGTVIYPGVVSHSTNAVEHPRLVADRIVTFAELVGPENVIASTDCGLGGRVHRQIAWAKLRSLVEGAQLASEELF